jgi:hypothetical protein
MVSVANRQRETATDQRLTENGQLETVALGLAQPLQIRYIIHV